jgi:hypothetical protein
MEGNTLGRTAMVEPGNARAPFRKDRVGLSAYRVICSGVGVVVMLVGSGMVFAIDDRRRLDGDRGLGRRQCPTPPSTSAEANASRPYPKDLLRRLELLGVGDRLMLAEQPGVSGAHIKVMYGYNAASEDAFEESLYGRAAVHSIGRLQMILNFRPIAHQMPPPYLLNGRRSARPH